MSRIASHTISDAPEVTRPLLEDMLKFSPTDKLLNLHAQMAHAPAVLEAYVGIRRAAASHGTLDQRVRTALMLTSAVADESEYTLAILSRLAMGSGWTDEQLAEAFVYLGLAVFTSYFLNYAETELDVASPGGD